MILMDASEKDAIRTLSNDERYAEWAAKYYGAGHHREVGHVVEPTNSNPETPDVQRH